MKNKQAIISVLAIAFAAMATPGTLQGSTITPNNLRCEYMTNPSVVDNTTPRLSWINEASSAEVRCASQSAYQLVVASSASKLEAGDYDVWDSGRRASSQSTLVAYEGRPLESKKDYWWKVRVWDENGDASSWSSPAHWGMGILDKSEWKAKWIGAPWQGEHARKVMGPKARILPTYPAPLFRKRFSINGKVASAKVLVSGLGYFEFYINGKKVGNDYLVPNFTNYSKRDELKYFGIAIDDNFRDYRVLYLSYDITDMLHEGENAAGAIVGNGFYDPIIHWTCPFGSPRMMCQIEITYADGSHDTVVSDDSWLSAQSALVLDDIYQGEIYDANREIANWASVDCDESKWINAKLRNAPTGQLTAQTSPTDKIIETLKPTSLKRLNDGSYEVAFAKEISGWIHLKGIKGHKGDTLDVKYICESPLGVQKYIFKDDNPIDHAPRFTWYVFSKAIISGVKNLKAENLEAEMVNTDVPVTAEFTTSNELFNTINRIWQQSQIDNMHGCVASDCPHRERSAYTGDGQVSMPTVLHNFDAAAFYQKWIRDIRDVQNVETGYVPNGAPWQPGCGGGVAWGAAMSIMPWEFYVHYGDSKMLADSYSAMKEQVDYMLTWLTDKGTMLTQATNVGTDQVNYWLNLGDWAPAYELPEQELVHSYFLWRCAHNTALAAEALGVANDAAHYSEVAENVKNAVNTHLYNASEESYGDFGSNLFALAMGVPSDRYDDVVKTLKNEITVKYKSHLNTGIFGTQLLFETLAAIGLNDLAYEVMNQTDFPSFGNWIRQGATVTWEQWNGNDSHNHPMFGGGLTWFYRTLAGVNTDINAPGYKHFTVRPMLCTKLDRVSYSNVTPYGKVASSIEKKGKRIELTVTVPVGSTATVFVPCTAKAKVSESGKAKGTKDCGYADGYRKFEVAQGTYHFIAE